MDHTFPPSLQTTRDLRQSNQQTLLRLIYFNELVSRLELSELSGLSPATVTNLVANLIQADIVVSDGVQESQGGRPRTRLTINPEFGRFVGVEVAETHIYTALYDMRLHKLDELHIDVSTDENRPAMIADYIAQSVKKLLFQFNIPDGKVQAVGIGMPGIVSRAGGVSIFAPNWGWHDVPLLDMLQTQLEMPIQLDNGMQALALAEHWFGAGREVNNLAALLMGTGVAAGIIIDGQLYRGVTNSAGEWGHSCVAIDGPPCRCGSCGCIETFIGAPGIIRQLSEINPGHQALKCASQQAILKAICDAALTGDPACSQALDQTAHYLAVGIANIINLFNPQLIVIGGWCGVQISAYVFPKFEPMVGKYALSEPFNAVKMSMTQFGGEGAIGLGAASLALESFLMRYAT
ncbi:ROK family protein [candidate division KSB3 bacterium]|nr:ROK family protein [candidate division KSB3 bacterium]